MTDGPNSDDPGDDGDEPRVRDLISRPTPEGGTHPLDPLTIARLAAWFDLPSVEQVTDEEAAAAAAAAAASTSDAQRVQKKRAEALAHVDPGFLAHLEGHRDAAATLPQIAIEPSRWERRLLAFDESQIPPLLDEDDYREVHIPPQLVKDLRDATPQAMLRDLHRPETDFYIQLQPAFEDAGEPFAPDPMAPVREILRSDYRVGVVDAAMLTMDRGIAGLRALLAQPWAESKRERARLREQELLGKEAPTAAVATEPEGAP